MGADDSPPGDAFATSGATVTLEAPQPIVLGAGKSCRKMKGDDQ